jgi:hypothetical protein
VRGGSIDEHWRTSCVYVPNGPNTAIFNLSVDMIMRVWLNRQRAHENKEISMQFRPSRSDEVINIVQGVLKKSQHFNVQHVYTFTMSALIGTSSLLMHGSIKLIKLARNALKCSQNINSYLLLARVTSSKINLSGMYN